MTERERSRRGRLPLALALTALGCAGADPTEIVVRVDSDVCTTREGGGLESVRVEVLPDPPTEPLFDSTFRADRYGLPGEVVLAATSESSTRVLRVKVYGALRAVDGAPARVIERQYRMRFAPGRRTVLEVFLAASCVDAPACEGRATCGPSGCEPIDRPWLPDWAPALGRGACVDPELDGGVPPDVPVPPDAPSCPSGTTRCGGTCRDLASDVAHCGRCGAACAPSNGNGACMAGRCVIASCAAGWADCDGATSNGCEANLAVSATHCGRCNNRCATGACTAGTCEAAPPVILRNFGGSTGFGPDEQCLHPTDEDAWAGPPPVGAMPAARPIPLNFAFARGLTLGTRTLTQMFVNANGTVSFIDPVPAFDATNDVRSSQPVLAPWWADVDTRLGGFPSQNVICFALQPGIVAATWYEVGYYDRRVATRDTFQVVMREVATPDDWDIEFRYGQCQWTTGDASEGVSGLGGTPAVAGVLPGDNLAFIPLPGSGTNAVIDLCTTSNTGQAGVWRARVRRGAPAL